MRTLRVPTADGLGAGHPNRSGARNVMICMTKKRAGRSRRAPADGKRDHRVAVRFTEAELARIDARAEAEGLLNAAWIGIAALAMADRDVAAGRASQEEINKLTAAVEQARRAGCALNQAVMTMRALGQFRPSVQYIADRVWHSVRCLDDAVVAVTGPVSRTRRRR